MSANAINENISWNYFKSDKNLAKKIGIFYGFFVLNFLLNMIPILGFILTSLISMIITGYYVNNAHIRIFKPENKLAEWSDFKNLFLIGFKVVSAYSIIFLPGILTISCYMLAIYGQLFLAYNTSAVMNTPIINNSSLLVTVVILSVVLVIISTLYMMVSSLIFIADLKFRSFFKFKTIKLILTKRSKMVWGYIGKIILYTILMVLLSGLLGITFVGILAIPALAFFYMAIVSDIQAQYIRKMFNIGQGKTNG